MSQHASQYKGSRLDLKAPATIPPATIPYFLQEQIRDLIVDGTIRPGQPLREQELEQRFGTSRSPIREALRLLELSGLVTHVQRKGFRVTLYSEVQIRHLYELRAELEAYCLRQVASLPDLGPLLDQLRRLDAARDDAFARRDIRAYLAALRDFYLVGARHTGNAPLRDVLAKLYEQVEPLRYMLARRIFESGVKPDLTEGVADALERGDFDHAAQLARGHVLTALPGILEAYRDTLAQDAQAQPRLPR